MKVACTVWSGEKTEMTSKSYLSLSLILQTLQQLRDVYGDSVDKIVQGNASKHRLLWSQQTTILKPETMSGVTHKVRADSKTVTSDMVASQN